MRPFVMDSSGHDPRSQLYRDRLLATGKTKSEGRLAAKRRLQDALRSFLAGWDNEHGPVNDHDIDALADRYDL